MALAAVCRPQPGSNTAPVRQLYDFNRSAWTKPNHHASCRIRCRSGVDNERKREIGCSDLYNMTEAIRSQNETGVRPLQQQVNASSTSSNCSDVPPTQSPTDASSREGQQQPFSQQQQQQQQDADRGMGYYAGLLTTDVRTDNKATSTDMLKRNLQFAGGVTLLLVVLTYIFMASNGLV